MALEVPPVPEAKKAKRGDGKWMASGPSNAPLKGGGQQHGKALEFRILAKQGRARASVMRLPHYDCRMPMFMPVGTNGSVKGLTPDQLRRLDCHLVLGNTYHLESRPGADVVEEFGGLHEFSRWDRAMLTDSGGFQMVSLLHLADITEEGVSFQNPTDGQSMMLTPEHSMRIQNKLGADIMMALDDVVSSVNPSLERFEEATYRTTRWFDRCLEAHERPHDQNLFPIVQGGLDYDLRQTSLKQLMERDARIPGYAIGGLAGGEDKESFWNVVDWCTAALPEQKPRYVMGIGYPVDIVVCSALGADMYDCVYPTRTARFGTALVPTGVIRLPLAGMEGDHRPIDEDCECMVCRKYTRSQLHRLVCKDSTGAILVSYHNVHYMMQLMKGIRESIVDQRFPEFVRDFMKKLYPDGAPEWVARALKAADIEL
ncbi:queuine tRNA-ribosyltransferase [Chloropicon primus]|uniref:Queuine tRNA-ribosyltransferase catalytic subunit 1 n=1 Tax=Chloropicon primus TaxID=1764295 RepID=A0A5B8MPF8_9CHLO|nr:queuine tRNA-ribosyltransferase [Chloropicon primus]UPR00695.1 queuine tRNA-ribosyltransferase [Chloropicon primus]|mmetsp:Transcript_2625/g.7226  ORF Transcript_2625/g.7226 Transcript_2625/m.7226 type:complete len:428 (+) Transcript_2625:45-1328(+)|eukprot:QDZ21485.1 queuine tRNA-ribosyltransferase [Chloropicon primus]